jgi:transcription initiation factor IIE alpha subunit
MQNQEVLAAVGEQGENIRAIIDEVEERKEELDSQYKSRLKAVEQEVLPLLIHLAKNDDKEYLYWPNRVEVVKTQIGKVLSATRG